MVMPRTNDNIRWVRSQRDTETAGRLAAEAELRAVLDAKRESAAALITRLRSIVKDHLRRSGQDETHNALLALIGELEETNDLIAAAYILGLDDSQYASSRRR